MDFNKLSKEIEIEVVMTNLYNWKQHSKFEQNKICDICMDNMKDLYVLETNCGHFYHYNCIMITFTEYQMLKCPTCFQKYKLL